MARTTSKGKPAERTRRSVNANQRTVLETRLLPAEPIQLLEEARKRIQSTSRVVEKRAAQLRRELADQGQRLAHDVRKFARQRLQRIEGRIATTVRPAQREVQQLRSIVTRRLEALRNRLETEFRHFVTTRLDLATHAELARLRRRLEALETRLARVERAERATVATKPAATPSAAA